MDEISKKIIARAHSGQLQKHKSKYSIRPTIMRKWMTNMLNWDKLFNFN